jgi:ubiquitin-protein ligase
MASQKDQRTSDFNELQQTLAQHPRIRIIQTEGEPPDCYEIEYNLTGLVKAADGSISKASKHLILFTLPFGYPHFPPAVKPLTPIFHPDMDPDAVRISSYWQNSPSLAKLVLHLGDMICGKEYELEEPFNQEAADWYAAHAAELPCDTAAAAGEADELDLDLDLGLADLDEPAHAQEIDLSSALAPALEIEDMTDLEPVETDSGAELSFELESPQPVHDLAGLTGQEEEQTRQEDTEEEDFGLELDLAPEPEPAAEQPPQDIGPKLDEIRVHIRRKEMEIAARLLAGLPALPEVEDLRLRVRTALTERDELLAELKAFEDDDNFDEAKKVFKKIKAVAADTPDLAEIGRRLEQSQNMLNAFSLPSQKAEAEDESAAEEESIPSLKKKEKRTVKEAPPRPRKEKPKEKKEISMVKRQIVRTVYREVPVMPFAIAAVVAAVIIVIGLIYTRDTNNLLEAQLAWQDAQQFFRQRDCQKADAKANAALAILKTVLTPLPVKGGMRKEIAELTASEEYQLCKEGQGLYNGKPMPLPELKKRQELDKLLAATEHALQQGSISLAVEMIEKAEKFAAENGLPLPDNAQALKKRVFETILTDALQRVQEAEQIKDWEAVVKYSRQGLDASERLKDRENKNKFNAILEDALFSDELHRVKRQFGNAHGQWQQLLEQLKTLQKRMLENPDAATPEKKLQIEQLMARCQFYQLLSLANEAYSSNADDDAAVSYYEQALTLLNKKQHLFTKEEQATAEQVENAILMIRISSLWNKAVSAESADSLSSALNHYKEIGELLRKYGLVKDEGLRLVKEKTDSRVSRLQQVVKEQRNNDWLQRNYKKICANAYPSVQPEKLHSPKLDFIKMINGQEHYKVSCREGRMYRFEIDYLHNPATGQWTPCPNCQ